MPTREKAPGLETLVQLLEDSSEGDQAQGAGVLALAQEIRRTRDELDEIVRRLSELVPRGS